MDCYERTGPCRVCGRDTTGGVCECITLRRCPDCQREMLWDVCLPCSEHARRRDDPLRLEEVRTVLCLRGRE
jgi:hypothetical protein